MNIPVIDVVNSFSRTKNQEWGIEGYNIRSFNPYLDKASTLKFKNDKNSQKTSFIDDIIKKRKPFPAPGLYDTTGSLLQQKKHSNLCKSPRVTLPTEIEQIEKKYQQPGPGAYEIKPVSKKVLGAFNLKD